MTEATHYGPYVCPVDRETENYAGRFVHRNEKEVPVCPNHPKDQPAVEMVPARGAKVR